MMKKTAKLIVKPNGDVVFVYDDALRPFIEASTTTTITRVSHVEPTTDGKWNVDMTPVGGPASLGVFEKRADALAAEVEWLGPRLAALPITTVH